MLISPDLRHRTRRSLIAVLLGMSALTAALAPPQARAAGLLTPTGESRSLSIASQQVNVVINNGIAVTTVTQVFHNDGPRPLEARYTFPIPARASVSNFSMWINGKEVVGEVVEKREGQRLYDTIVRPQTRTNTVKDPGLLEETTHNIFEMKVFPVPANGDQRIQIAYYQPLDYENGVMRYVYPLAMRDQVATEMAGPLSITVEARSEIPIKSIVSPTHPDALANATFKNTTFRAGIEEPRGRLDRDFVVYFELERPKLGIDLLTSRDPSGGGDGFFALMLTPGSELDHDPHPVHATFVVDSSGSMSADGKLRAACRATLAAIKSLREGDTFSIIAFNVGPTAMSEQPIAADEAGLSRAEQFLRTLSPKGGTDILAALDAATVATSADHEHAIILLSDGEATEAVDYSAYVALVNRQTTPPRVVSIGVGNDVNRPLLDRLSRDTGGFVAYLSAEDDMNALAPGMVQRLRVPYAQDIKVTTSGGGVELYDLTPDPQPNLYHGGQFVLFGRYRGTGESKLTLAANIQGQPRTIDLDAKFPAVDATAPEIQRMWAWHRIQDMMRGVNDGTASQSVQDDIIALGTAYSITSPYTSFIVLENEQMYRDFNIQRRNRERIATERQAQVTRAQSDAPIGQQFRPAENAAPQGGGNSGFPSIGGGAISPIGLLMMGGSVVAAVLLRRRMS